MRRAALNVRVGHQPEDGYDTRADDPPSAAAPGRRGHPLAPIFIAVASRRHPCLLKQTLVLHDFSRPPPLLAVISREFKLARCMPATRFDGRAWASDACCFPRNR